MSSYFLSYAGNPPVLVDLRMLPIGDATLTISVEIAGTTVSDTVPITSE